jgi:hypothetical protein
VTRHTPRQLWRDAIRESDDPALDPLTIAVAFALDRDMTANGRTLAGVRRLAKLAHCNKDTAGDRVGRLVAAGWLARLRRGYQATLPEGLEVSDPVGQSTDGEVSDPAGQSSEEECPTGAAEVSDGSAQSVRPGRTVPGNHSPGNHFPASSSSSALAARGVTSSAASADDDDRLIGSGHPADVAAVQWLEGGRPHGSGCACSTCLPLEDR